MKNHAFTLIELLVVILIIAVLAAIAYPQYQKAIIRSKLASIEVNVNTLFKSMEMYEMANGTATQYRNVDMNTLDVGIQFDSYNSGDHTYKNKYGRWELTMSGADSSVYFYGTGSMDKISLGFIRLTEKYDRTRKIRLYTVPQELTYRKLVCQWWVQTHGTGRMANPAGTLCREVGVQ